MYGMEHGGWMFGGGFVMLLWWLLPIAVVVAVAAYLARGSARKSARSDALEILEKRYASGEIGKDEFGRMRRDLGS